MARHAGVDPGHRSLSQLLPIRRRLIYMAKKLKIDEKALKKRLKRMRKEVMELSEATEQDRLPVKLDQTTVGRLSRIDALQTQAMQLETERRRIMEIQRIDSALQRLNDGAFGYCVSCGVIIEPKRLENNPTTPTCFDCAQLSEN